MCIPLPPSLPARQIRLALQATGGNKSEAAWLLRTDYKTLHVKMKQYGIDAGPFRESRGVLTRP